MTIDDVARIHPDAVPPERGAPVRPGPGPAEIALVRIGELSHLVDTALDTPVTGPRGQLMTLAAARDWAFDLGTDIALAEARGSLRHHAVSAAARRSAIGFLAVVDFPIMFWLASSVFNVDWLAPVGLPLAISIVVSLLATVGSAAALHHIGHELRDHKTDTRQLPVRSVPLGGRLGLVAAVLLVAMVAVVMFVRVHSEGTLSGLDGLAVLLATLVALVMLVSAGLVFWSAFRDGSPERDDLRFYAALVTEHLARRHAHQQAAVALAHRYRLLAARPVDEDHQGRISP